MKSSNDLVSVVLVTYERPCEILVRAVKSVIAQTYGKIEIIVINDAPENVNLKEEIREALDRIDDKRIRYYVNSKNLGANAARNNGLNLANGKYIAFLDDDDEWAEDKIERQVEEISKEDNIALVYGRFINCWPDRENVKQLPIYTGRPINEILEGNFIGGTSFPMLRTEAVRSVGGFDTSLVSCQEYELWIRLISKYTISYCNSILGKYYYSDDSTFKNNSKYIAGIIRIVEKHKELYDQYPRSKSNRFVSIAFNLLKSFEIKNAIIFKRKAIKADWKNPNNILLVYMFKRITGKGKCN